MEKKTCGSAVFYTPGAVATEIRSGYLFKSPPPNRMKSEKSWKRRYFVLFKISEQEHQLKYFRSPREKDKPLGRIDLDIDALCHLMLCQLCPSKWGWIQKNFKCSPSSVLCIKACDRDYFLVGESRSGSWFLVFFLGRSDDGRRCFFLAQCLTQLSRLTCGSPQHVKINTTPLNEALAVVCVSFSSLDTITPEERDIEVKHADLKKHLTLTEVEGKPCVSGWTGQPQSVCLFHKGDQILAINDLHTSSVDEFNMYLSKSLKNEVKVTILRQRGCRPLHSPTGLCSD
uniref:PH domain-containing protein n=1 Tax=Sparus aurata TaxID=8175 RepID=A0A671X253_SPAAU